MRTSGEFVKIYASARGYLTDPTHQPINPVVRLEGEIWMLESDLEPSNCSIEIPLEAFQDYWYYAMQDAKYEPLNSDIEDFIQIFCV
jgi:hypothetical protein